MGLNTAAVQRLYIAYFNRPADSTGLAYWESQLALNSTTVAATQAQLTTLAARGFSGSAEYAALYAGQNNDQIIDNLYMNLFGRHAEPAGLTSWSLALTNGTQTFASIALQLTYSAQGTDATAIANKQAAATSFTTALDTTTEITGYSGTAAAATARAWLATVTDTAASVTAAAASMDASIASATAGGGAVGATYTLTTGVDGPTNFVGGSANDTFNAGTSASLSAFDNIDGGAGTDTLSALITTTALPGSLTVKNIETATINTTGAGFSDTFTGWTGLTSLTVQDATAGAIALTTASTTGVTVAGTGVSSVRIDGGGAVGSVTTGAGAVDIGKTGAVINAFTSLTVTGGTTVDISNNKTAAANSGLGTTLTAVSVSGNTGLVTVKAASLATLNLASSTAGATITATAGARTLGLNTVTGGTVTDATATSLTVNATGTASSAVTLTAGAATSVAFNNAVNLTVADVNLGAATAITVAGAGKLVISATTAVGVLTSVDASLNSGGVTITRCPFRASFSDSTKSLIRLNVAVVVTAVLRSQGICSFIRVSSSSKPIPSFALVVTKPPLILSRQNWSSSARVSVGLPRSMRAGTRIFGHSAGSWPSQ